MAKQETKKILKKQDTINVNQEGYGVIFEMSYEVFLDETVLYIKHVWTHPMFRRQGMMRSQIILLMKLFFKLELMNSRPPIIILSHTSESLHTWKMMGFEIFGNYALAYYYEVCLGWQIVGAYPLSSMEEKLIQLIENV